MGEEGAMPQKERMGEKNVCTQCYGRGKAQSHGIIQKRLGGTDHEQRLVRQGGRRQTQLISVATLKNETGSKTCTA